MNLFRVPLNFIVIVILTQVHNEFEYYCTRLFLSKSSMHAMGDVVFVRIDLISFLAKYHIRVITKPEVVCFCYI